MADLSKLVVEVAPKGITDTTKQLGDMAKASKTSETSVTDLAKKIAGFTTAADLGVRAAQALIGGVKDLAVQSVQLAAGFEKAQITWGVLVGDMTKGEEIFGRLRDFAAATPLSFEAVESAAQTLAGFGVATQDLIPTLSKLGDLSRGDNSALGRLALVFGQVQAQGKAMTQDLYQFVNSGVPIFQMLADSMGVATGEIKDLAAEGKIGFNEISAAINKATEEGGKYFGLMDTVADTTSGKWSTAVDNFKLALADLGNNVLPMVNRALDAFNESFLNRAAGDTAQTVLSGGSTSIAQVEMAIVQYKKMEAELLKTALAGEDNVELQSVQSVIYRLQRELGGLRTKEGLRAKDPAAKSNTVANSLPYDVGDINNSIGPIFNPWGPNPGAMNLTGLGGSAAGASLFSEDYSIDDINNSIGPILRLGEAYSVGAVGLSEFGIAALGAGDTVETLTEKQEEAKRAAELFKTTMEKLGDQLSAIAEQSTIDMFKSLGEAMTKGSEGAESFEESMLRLGIQITNQLPLLMLQAGLQLVANPATLPLGLALIAGSGLVAIGAGAANAAYSDAKSKANKSIGAPSVDYGQSVTRSMSGGGGSNVSVVVNNLASGTTATQEQRTSSDGSREIVVTVKNIVKNMVPTGELDGILARGGVAPRGVRT